MPTFYVKSRTTHPVEITTVEADTREGAIQQTLDAADEGDTVEVMQVQEGPFVEDPTGPTGATGPASRSEPAKPNRAQLNEMTKDELLAVAAKEGVEVAAHWNKADIVDAIVKHKRT